MWNVWVDKKVGVVSGGMNECGGCGWKTTK